MRFETGTAELQPASVKLGGMVQAFGQDGKILLVSRPEDTMQKQLSESEDEAGSEAAVAAYARGRPAACPTPVAFGLRGR